jgi:hypothetical protein
VNIRFVGLKVIDCYREYRKIASLNIMGSFRTSILLNFFAIPFAQRNHTIHCQLRTI